MPRIRLIAATIRRPTRLTTTWLARGLGHRAVDHTRQRILELGVTMATQTVGGRDDLAADLNMKLLTVELAMRPTCEGFTFPTGCSVSV